jgi:hypothetical protein
LLKCKNKGEIKVTTDIKKKVEEEEKRLFSHVDNQMGKKIKFVFHQPYLKCGSFISSDALSFFFLLSQLDNDINIHGLEEGRREKTKREFNGTGILDRQKINSRKY